MLKILLVVLLVTQQITCNLEQQEVTATVDLHINIADQPAGILKIGVFGKVVPLTSQNFISICKGETVSKISGQLLTYNNTPFHRIIPHFMLQTGDICNGDGTGSDSIYGSSFPDENFQLLFQKYAVAMANSGPDTNGSQFFITVEETQWLNGRHVVFGRLLDQNSVQLAHRIEQLGSQAGTPNTKVVISQCTVV